jgi:predicted outer membrane lipoprotein
MASAGNPVGITTVAPYAAFGALYFLIAALWLTVSDARKRSQLKTS